MNKTLVPHPGLTRFLGFSVSSIYIQSRFALFNSAIFKGIESLPQTPAKGMSEKDQYERTNPEKGMSVKDQQERTDPAKDMSVKDQHERTDPAKGMKEKHQHEMTEPANDMSEKKKT